jgi:hypothetical protein
MQQNNRARQFKLKGLQPDTDYQLIVNKKKIYLFRSRREARISLSHDQNQ